MGCGQQRDCALYGNNPMQNTIIITVCESLVLLTCLPVSSSLSSSVQMGTYSYLRLPSVHACESPDPSEEDPSRCGSKKSINSGGDESFIRMNLHIFGDMGTLFTHPITGHMVMHICMRKARSLVHHYGPEVVVSMNRSGELSFLPDSSSSFGSLYC